MRRMLLRHPESRSAAIAIEADASRPSRGVLALRFTVTGDAAALILPAPASPARTDDLWKHTCFEAFVRAPSGAAYYELNFAPSGHWAAYRFESYRAGMRDADDIAAPRFASTPAPMRYQLTATLGVPLDGPWRVGLSAVIEDKAHGLSYWALAHPPGRPDFHHHDCFALDLSPESGS